MLNPQALQLLQQYLANFAVRDDFETTIATIFGTDIDVVELVKIRQQWLDRDLSVIPPIEIRPRAEINSADGAFAVATGKIYLAQELVENSALEGVIPVLLEEYGHFVDARLNTVDTSGDEGAIFSALVRGETLNASQLSALKTEDDRAIVQLDGQSIQIEQAGAPTSNPFYKYDIIAKIGDLGITDFEDQPSINDKGTVAFIGYRAHALTVESAVVLDPSLLKLISQSITLAQEQLSLFAQDPEFAQKMALAFGDSLNPSGLQDLQTQWQVGDLGGLPALEILAASQMNGANGAYAAGTDKIYLSQGFLQLHQNNASAIAAVLLEEIGHRIDRQINATDSPGDEGEIFAAVASGQDLDSSTLDVLKQEDDSTVLSLNGANILVEQSTYSTGFNLQNLGFQFKTADYLNKLLGTNVRNSYEFNSEKQFKFIQEFDKKEVEAPVDVGFGGGKAGIYLDPGSIGAGLELKAGYNLGELKLNLPVSAVLNTTVVNNQLNFNINASLSNPEFS